MKKVQNKLSWEAPKDHLLMKIINHSLRDISKMYFFLKEVLQKVSEALVSNHGHLETVSS